MTNTWNQSEVIIIEQRGAVIKNSKYLITAAYEMISLFTSVPNPHARIMGPALMTKATAKQKQNPNINLVFHVFFFFSIHLQECRLIFFCDFSCVTKVPHRVAKGQRITRWKRAWMLFFHGPIRTSRKCLLAGDLRCQHGTARGLSTQQEPIAGAANIFRAA